MAKYYHGEPVKTVYNPDPELVKGSTLYCYKCNEVINLGDMVVGRDVYKCGEHDYTKIVHAPCYTGPTPVEVLI